MYTSGTLHPTRENGVIFFQNVVRTDIIKHFELEGETGKPVNPAIGEMMIQTGNPTMCKEDAICAAVEEGGRLAW